MLVVLSMWIGSAVVGEGQSAVALQVSVKLSECVRSQTTPRYRAAFCPAGRGHEPTTNRRKDTDCDLARLQNGPAPLLMVRDHSRV